MTTSQFKRQPSPSKPEVMTLAEASRFLRLDTRTVRRLLEEGALRGNRAGRAIRLSRASVYAWFEQQRFPTLTDK